MSNRRIGKQRQKEKKASRKSDVGLQAKAFISSAGSPFADRLQTASGLFRGPLGSIAARISHSLSRSSIVEYLLKPLSTATSAELVQTVMSYGNQSDDSIEN